MIPQHIIALQLVFLRSMKYVSIWKFKKKGPKVIQGRKSKFINKRNIQISENRHENIPR